ncbi:MAG: hypothetical protein NDI77_06000 [Geobacteraceae bacterium]|nr:hypothetical protein [Geobacteraceae bacterium]
MRKLVYLLLALVSLFATGAAQGKTPYIPSEELKAGAERGFGEILDLWRDGRYDELYDRTMVGGTQTKEGFVGRLAAGPYRPACCWEKLQEVRVTVKTDDTALIRAKVGLEGGSATTFKTRDFRLVKEDGLWRISQADILSLAGGSGKKGSNKKKK